MIAVEKNPLQRLVLRLAGRRFIGGYPFEEMFFLGEWSRDLG